jgi:hypothetical protein
MKRIALLLFVVVAAAGVVAFRAPASKPADDEASRSTESKLRRDTATGN